VKVIIVNIFNIWKEKFDIGVFLFIKIKRESS